MPSGGYLWLPLSSMGTTFSRTSPAHSQSSYLQSSPSSYLVFNSPYRYTSQCWFHVHGHDSRLSDYASFQFWILEPIGIPHMLNATLILTLVCCRWGTRDQLHFSLWIPTKSREGGGNWEFWEDLIEKKTVAIAKVVQNIVPTTVQSVTQVSTK